MAGVNAVTPLEPEKSVNFTGESLKVLRNELKGTDATLLGFVGASLTLATYIGPVGRTVPITKLSKKWHSMSRRFTTR